MLKAGQSRHRLAHDISGNDDMLTVNVKKELSGFALDVSFVLEHGVMAILGASGAGKTMTLQCIAGLLQPDSGHIELNSHVLFDSSRHINLPAQKRKVGFVFQNYALFPHLNVIENVAYGIRHLPRQQVQERVHELLKLMHVDTLGQRHPSQLSAGQQQRVAIARAMAPGPEILLFDEPFSALDLQLKERLELEFLALQEHFKGDMLLVTHDLAEGYKLAQKIAVFQAGSIIQCGSKHNIFFAPVNSTVARLTGIRNLIKGNIVELNADFTSIYIPAWGKTLQAVCHQEHHLEINQPVTVGIRSEQIKLYSEGENNTLDCRVIQTAEGISTISYRLQVESDSEAHHLLNVTVHKNEKPCLTPNHNCTIYLPAEHLIIITG